MNSALLLDGKIELSFAYDEKMVALVKTLPDRTWDSSNKVWKLPATKFHAQSVINKLPEFYVDPAITKLANQTEKVELSLPKEFKHLYHYQKEGVKFIANAHGNCIVADDMGLGKSAEALVYMSMLRVKSLIVSPSNVIYKWKDEECRRWAPTLSALIIKSGTDELSESDITIMSYAMMVAKYEEIKSAGFELVIFDECFVKDTKIKTMKGEVSIQDVRPGMYVASVSSSNVVEYKKVLAVNRQPASDKLYDISGTVSTANHPYYTEESGYVSAEEICLRGGYTLRRMPKYIQHQQVPTRKILLQKMFGAMESKAFSSSFQNRPDVRREDNQSAVWTEASRCITKNEITQSNVDARSKGTNDFVSIWKNLLVSGRKWKSYKPTIKAGEVLGMGRGDRVSNWSFLFSALRKSSEMLQSRYRKSGEHVGDRGGWKKPQDKEMEILRQTKDSYTEPFRVESYTVYERGSGCEFDEVCPDGHVYNLEVEDNHNYFANGFLVHNCHYLKSPKSQRGRVAKSLAKHIQRKLYLSGTPFENRPAELFPILNAIDPVGFNNFYSYATRYCGAIKEGNFFQVPRNVATNASELAGRLKNYMIRRTKQEVAIQLPELSRSMVPVPLSKTTEYKKALAEFQEWAKSGKKKTSALVKLTALRQIIGKEKLEPAIELAESVLESGRQVVLFAHHKEVVSALHKHFKLEGCGVISGDTAPEDRQKLARAFNLDNSKIRVMIITVAGAEGINLFGASDIIFVEREWTPAKEEQAEARLHRLGQKNAVTSYYLVATNTIDEHMNKLVEEKRKLFNQVIGQDEILTSILEKYGG
jgi:SNF2 family DNA or RNA helicase